MGSCSFLPTLLVLSLGCALANGKVSSFLRSCSSLAPGMVHLVCSSHSEQVVQLNIHGPNDQFGFDSNMARPRDRSVDQYNRDHVKCKWILNPMHGSLVKIRHLNLHFPENRPHCAGSILRIYNEDPSSNQSGLHWPGYQAQCGVNTFPMEKDLISYFAAFIGTNPVTCPEEETKMTHCPYGPCCQSQNGTDCCVIHLGSDPIEITSTSTDVNSFGTVAHGTNLKCMYRLKTTTGSQILVNFKKIDMVAKSSSGMNCHQQKVMLAEDTECSTPYSLIKGNQSFCGQLVPNFPGPSALTSSSNHLDIHYTTSSEKMQRGAGYIAAVSAINPLCAPLQVYMKYSTTVCEHTCGVKTYRPTTPKPPSCSGPPTLKVRVRSDKTGHGIPGVQVTMQTENPVPIAKFKSTIKTTGSDGRVEDVRFPREEIKITSQVDGFDTFVQVVDLFTSCFLEVEVSLSPVMPNTTCTNVPAKFKFVDSVSQKTIPQVMFDVYKLPMGCPAPKEDTPLTTVTLPQGGTSPVQRPAGSTQAAATTTESMQSNEVLQSTTNYPAAPTYILQSSTSNNLDTTTSSPGLLERIFSRFKKPTHTDRLERSDSSTTTTTASGLEGLLPPDSRQLNTTTDTTDCAMTLVAENLVTDTNSALAAVTAPGQYLIRNVRHPSYPAPAVSPLTKLDCSLAACQDCKLRMYVNLTLPSCTTAKLHIHVRTKETDEPVVGAKVDVFLGSAKRNSKPLVTDTNGEVELEVPDKGTYKVKVTPDDTESLEKMVTTSCDPNNCTACAALVKFFPTPIEHPEPCPNTTLSVNVVDSISNSAPANLTISVHETSPPNCDCDSQPTSLLYFDCLYKPLWHMLCMNGIAVSTLLVDKVSSLSNHIIKQNGKYKISVSSPGFRSTHTIVEFNCTQENCRNCSQTLNLNLTQIFCEATQFKVSVSSEGSAIEEATVSMLTQRSKNNADGSTTMQYVQKYQKLTSSAGIAYFPVSGNTKSKIKIFKEGYLPFEEDVDVFCNLGVPCSRCNPSLLVGIKEQFCNSTVKLRIYIKDEADKNITGAQINLKLKKEKGYTIISNNSHNKSDCYEELLTQFGLYSVEVSSEGYLPESKDVQIQNGTACIEHLVNMTMTLKSKEAPFACPKDSKIKIFARDDLTKAFLLGVNVVVKLKDTVLLNGTMHGTLELAIASLGDYVVSVSKENYDVKKILVVITNDTCSAEETVYLDQPRCKDVAFPVTVTDYHNHEKPIVNAIVELVQLHTLSGPSNQVLAKKHTNAQGVANFTLQMNGKYLVKVSADGYISGDEELVLNCTKFHCQACNPVLKPQLKEQFCENKNMAIIISDALKNHGVGGATIEMWIEINSLRDGLQTFTTNEEGQALVPLMANGQYKINIAHPDYLPLTRDYQINVQPGLCDAYHPIDLSPLSPKLPEVCEEGVRASLSWGEQPKDLDLYSYRVDNNNTDDCCLTYFCDGKDPCSGTTHDIDNKNGGLNGSETITFCDKKDYVNMIYADEVTGRAADLASSGAKLVLQAKHQSAVIHIKPPANQGKRYWLVGCLILEHGGFTFLEVNQFFSGQPNVKQPHFCYDEIQLRRKAQNAATEVQGELGVEVKAENWTSVPGATVELRTPSDLSHYRSTTLAGRANFSVLQDGFYAVMVRAEGFYPTFQKVAVECSRGALYCSKVAKFQLIKIWEDGAIRLNLAWKSEQFELNLHTLQVDSQLTTTSCKTYYNQPSTCSGVDYGSEGDGQSIVIRNAAATPTHTYMVFIEDHSATPHLNLSEARLSISDGATEKIHPMPAYRAYPGDKYWLAGCLASHGDSFLFLGLDEFSRDSPEDTKKLACVELLEGQQNKPLGQPFCSRIHLSVKVVDSLDNSGVTSNISVVRRQGEVEECIEVQESYFNKDTGSYEIPISANGVYHIEANASSYSPGYTPGHAEVQVACELSRCVACQPQVVLPLVGELQEGRARLAVVLPGHQGDVDLYVVQRSIREHKAVCSSLGGSTCLGVKALVLAHGDASVSRFESLEIEGGTNEHLHYYLVVLDLQNMVLDDQEAASSSGRAPSLTITDYSGEEVRVKMNMKKFERDKYWIAGCFGGEFMLSSSFSEVNLFLDTPPEDGKDYCKYFLKMGLRNCFAGAQGPFYDVADALGWAAMTGLQKTMKMCADSCTLDSDEPLCDSWQWEAETQICRLFQGGKLSGRLPSGSNSYAGVCPHPQNTTTTTKPPKK